MKTIRSPRDAWDMLILFWSAFIVFSFLYDMYNPANAPARGILEIGDNAACAFFLVDVLWRWLASPHKIKFWLWGWIDLLASIPYLTSLRMGRLVRVFFICREIRGLRAGERVLSYFFGKNRVHSTMAVSGILLFGSMFVGCTLLLHYESQDPQSQIQTTFDAFWWVITTITTVGSTIIPATFGGRLVGLFLMLAGITMFSINSALVVNALIQNLSHAKRGGSADNGGETQGGAASAASEENGQANA